MQISFWEKETYYATQDVIIIGAGLAGLWCAYELLIENPKLKILILEKGITPMGASTRNAGFACFGSPTELLRDIETIGEEKMLEIAEMRYKGIQKIRKIFGDKVIDYDVCGGYECLNNELHDLVKLENGLVKLNKQLKQITAKEKTFVWANDKMKQYELTHFDGLIENDLEGALHSGKLVLALTQKVQSLGANIINGIEVKEWEEGDIINVITKQDMDFRCSQLMICTNGFTNFLLPQLNIMPARGQVLVTNEINNVKLAGTFHYNEGYYYFRNIGKRILLGGARNISFSEEATNTFATTDEIQNELENFITKHILSKHNFTIDYRWSGIMGFTENKLPMTKMLSKNIHTIIACNGMGVALLPVFAEKWKKSVMELK